MTYVSTLQLHRQLWVRKAGQLAHCKMWPDIEEHPDTFGLLHFTNFVIWDMIDIFLAR